MNRCRECFAELSPGAAHCPQCGRELGPPVTLPPPPDHAGNRRVAIIVAGIVGALLLVAVIGIWASAAENTDLAPLDQSNVAAEAASPNAELVVTTAEALGTAFEENGLAAKDRFEGRPIRVTGVVLRIGSNMGEPTISLQSSVATLAAFGDPGPLKPLKSGQEVTITCQVLTEEAGVLGLRGCVLNAHGDPAPPVGRRDGPQ